MNDFKTRLLAEKKELKEKLDKLNEFLGTEKCAEISREQKTLLIIQSKSMDTYVQCLEARLVILK